MKRYHNKLICGCDPGNFNYKSATQVFTSGYIELAGTEFKYNDMLEYKGRVFSLTNDRIPLRDDKTVDDDFYILTLFAVAKELMQHKVPSGEYNIVLSVGLPPGHLSIPGLRDRTQHYYKKNADIVYNGRRYKLNVVRVVVGPQGYPALLAPVMSEEMERLAAENRLDGATRPIDILVNEPSAILIDIGGGTTEAIPFEFGVPKPSIMLSMSVAIVDAYNDISAAIKAKTGRDVPESAIDMVLNGKQGVRITEQDNEIIQSYMNRNAQHLLKKLMETKLPFSSSLNMLVGGGASVIKPFWDRATEYFGVLDHLAEIRATAMGLEEMALMALMKEP